MRSWAGHSLSMKVMNLGGLGWLMGLSLKVRGSKARLAQGLSTKVRGWGSGWPANRSEGFGVTGPGLAGPPSLADSE